MIREKSSTLFLAHPVRLHEYKDVNPLAVYFPWIVAPPVRLREIISTGWVGVGTALGGILSNTEVPDGDMRLGVKFRATASVASACFSSPSSSSLKLKSSSLRLIFPEWRVGDRLGLWECTSDEATRKNKSIERRM